MNTTTTKTIALVEVGNDGHRTAYMRIFTASLISQNYQVLCLIPDTTPIKNWIDENYPDLKHQVQYKNYPYKWQAPRIPIIGERLLVLTNLVRIKKRVKAYEIEHEKQVDFIFFNYVDKFLVNLIPLFLFNYFVSKKWAALLIHSGTYRLYPGFLNKKATLKQTDYIFNSKRCSGLAVHDENIIEKLNERLRTTVSLFPEIADLTPPDSDHPIYNEIKARANGRIIVGTIGLELHKCGYEFLQIAQQADKDKYFFAFLGIFNEHVKNAYSPGQQLEFENYFSNIPDNAFVSLGHRDEGTDYNSIFCSFDIVFLMYRDFYNASNRLTKAAHFKKLVLTTDMGCIGDDVKTYKLGEVSENTVQTALEKLEVIRENITANNLPHQNWIEYSKKHHADILKEKFNLLFN